MSGILDEHSANRYRNSHPVRQDFALQTLALLGTSLRARRDSLDWGFSDIVESCRRAAN